MVTLTRAPAAVPAPAATRPAGPGATTAETEEETKRPTRLNYRPDIDGIRGAAAIMVMGYHAKVPGFEGAYIGLDLFFVVSGFVITNLLLSEFTRTGGIRWAAFYARRARRLIPAKATMLLGVLVLSFFVMSPTGGQQETAASAAAAASFVSNFFFWRVSDVSYFGHDPGTGVLLHTWSLSVEEQFYLGLPLLILATGLLARRFGRQLQSVGLVVCGLLVAGSLGLAMVLADPAPEAAYYLPLSRAYEFLLGVGLALLVAKVKLPGWIRQLIGLLGIGLVAYVLWQPMPTDGYPTYWALIPCFGALFMVWSGTGSNTATTWVLSNRLFVGLGLVSYGWYLWHWPFLVMGEAVNLAPPPLPVRVALVFAALGVALLSYKFIEGRFYNRAGTKVTSTTWAPPRIVVAGVASMALVATTAGVASILASDRAEEPEWSVVSAQVDDIPEVPLECATREQQIQQTPMACHLNEFDDDRGTIVLWGDSHAWMYIPSVMKAARGEDVNVVAFNMGTCPPLEPSEIPDIPCVENNRMALDFVEELSEGDQPLQVILGASWQSYLGAAPLNLMNIRNGDPQHNRNVETIASFFRQGAAGRLFEELGDLEVDVDVIAPIPEVPRSAPLCEARVFPLECNVSNAVFEDNERNAMRWLTRNMRELTGKKRLIDLSNELCDEKQCRAKVGNTMVFFDDNHISASFARRVSDYFEPSVRRALPREPRPGSR